MKAITWLASLTLGMSTLAAPAFGKELEGWSSDLTASLKQAKAEKKFVLVEFTGSDWCPPCIAMRKNVFSKKEFVEAAKKHFVLVELDFPKGNPDLEKKNQPLAEKYNIDGFPTVILMDGEGKEFGRFYASEYPTIPAFLKHLDAAVEKQSLD